MLIVIVANHQCVVVAKLKLWANSKRLLLLRDVKLLLLRDGRLLPHFSKLCNGFLFQLGQLCLRDLSSTGMTVTFLPTLDSSSRLNTDDAV